MKSIKASRFTCLGILLCIIGLLAGCGDSIKSGVVVSKEIHPAHNDTIVLPIYTGQTCNTYNKITTCTSNYIYVPWIVHYDTSYALKLENCPNTSKCKHGTAYVDQITYRGIKLGDYYERQKGDNNQKYEKVRKKN